MPNLKTFFQTKRSLLFIVPCIINFLLVRKTLQDTIVPNFTYIMKEEIQPPYNLGNLVTDLNIKNMKLSHELQQQSLSFIPSNQFGSKFLSIVDHSEQIQYLRLDKVFDRETNCDVIHKITSTKVDTNKCICKNFDPYICHFYVVLVLAPVHQSNLDYIIIIQIIIQDINDNPPRFSKSEISVSIPEDAQLNTRVFLPIAEDQDWYLNAIVDYKLQPSNTFSLFFVDEFSLNRSLFLTVRSLLDREIAQNYTEIIVAVDRGIETCLSTSLTVHIIILDVNDCAPVFSNFYNIHLFISEDVEVPKLLLKLNATDMDVGDNGQITYSIEPQPQLLLSQLFTVNPTNGELFIMAKLDREKQAIYVLTIWAQDHGSSPKSSSTKLTLNITDVNDNDPVINGLSNPEVMENNKTPLLITTYRITDPDLSHNISCMIAANNLDSSIFSFRKSPSIIPKEIIYHLITDSAFDREQKSSYNFTIICKDDVTEFCRFSSLSITLHILDMNDNYPEFIPGKKHFYQNESYIPQDGEFITQLKTIDKDQGLNSKIEYFLIHVDQSVFTVHLLSGKLFQLGALDFEKGPECLLIIGARDCGQPSFTASLTIKIDIIDINDNAPQYNGPTTIEITENNLIGTVLEVLNVTDKDTGLSGMTVTVIMEKSKEFSLVDNQLVALISFDREIQSEFLLKFEMKDFGQPIMTSTQLITIKILDINDNCPVIISPYTNQTISFPYNKYMVHQNIFQVLASDVDAGLNSTLRYFIEPNSHHFKIDLNSGWISLRHHLTRNNIGNFSLNLVVRDCGINVLQSNKPIIFIILKAELITWEQIRLFLFIHKWIFLTLSLVIIIVLFLILSVYFSRIGRLTEIQRNIQNKRYFGLNTFSPNEFQLEMVNQKYISHCQEDDFGQDCLYNLHNFNDPDGNDVNYNNGLVKNLMVHNSVVSNSDSGHGESAESRLLIDALPHIEVIPRDQSEIYSHRPIQYTIDWKNQEPPSLENLRLPESNSIGIQNCNFNEKRYENMNYEL